MATHVQHASSTQVAHPGRAALRTAVAYLLAAIAFLVAALPIIQETMDGYLPQSWAAWLTAMVAFLVALAALITRLMALAKAQGFLTRIGLGTGVETDSGKPDTGTARGGRVPATGARYRARANCLPR